MKKILTYLLPLFVVAALAAPVPDGTTVPKFLTPDVYTVHGGDTAHFMVTLDATVSSATVVNLTSSNSGLLTVPLSVTVQAGQSTATFNATCAARRPFGPSSVTVTASCNGGSQSAVISAVP